MDDLDSKLRWSAVIFIMVCVVLVIVGVWEMFT